MGLNFSYDLFFKSSQWEEVMQTVTEHILLYPEPEHQTELKLASSERLVVPLRQLFHDDPTTLVVDLHLLAKKDETIMANWEFTDTVFYLYGDFFSVWLTLFINHGSKFWGLEDPRLVRFRFAAPDKTTSQILLKFPTVREPFLDILEKHQGLCGLFDTEGDDCEVFWLKGNELAPPVQMNGEHINKRLQAML